MKKTDSGKNTYLYDPENPATHIIDVSENELSVPEDYTLEEQRADVLVYSTPVLEKEVTLTGDLTAKLYVSSSAVDTDFVVRLTDVDVHGKSIKLADGVLCARYRNGFEKGELMEPGCIYLLSIRMSKISYCFPKGHRIRITITSSAKNYIFPNSNTADGYDSQVTVIAENTVYHGGEYPSYIELFAEK